MKKQTKKTTWKIIEKILFLLLGVMLGMIIMYFLFIFGFERLLNASQGIIQNVNINFNETKIIEGLEKFVNQSGDLK